MPALQPRFRYKERARAALRTALLRETAAGLLRHGCRDVRIDAIAGACGIATCVEVRDDHALADLAARLKNLRGTLFARVLISADEPPRVLPLRDGAEIKSRFRAALGVKA